MKAKTKRVEVLFEPKEYRLIKNEAKSRNLSLGRFVREAVRSVVEAGEEEKKRAFEELFSGKYDIDLPEWDEIEKIIAKGHLPCGLENCE